MFDFFKKAFRDMKESAKAQHAVDKANFAAAKAESKAQFAEAKAMSRPEIRKKYAPRETDSPESKLKRIRRLDSGVTQKGTAWALVLGVIGTLVLGVGMCCCLVWERFFLGIAIGLLGTLMLALAYPVYTFIIALERKRIAPEILQLTDELMQK